jgi:hypothetical protein
VGLEGAHAKLVGQSEGLSVVDFGLRDIGGDDVGMDNAKLVQRQRLVPASLLLPGQVECPACVLPGIITGEKVSQNHR